MALSFLLCPLARSPQSCATATRCRVDRDICRPQPVAGVDRIGEANLKSSSPTALGGYRPGGCQVSESPRQMWLIAAGSHKKGGREKSSASRRLLDPSRQPDQALALLSTARSERSA